MFSTKRLCLICDIDTITNPETLDKEKVVANAKKVICDQDLVGIQTQTLAQMQGMTFVYSVVIDRMYYNKQKYIYIDGQVYEIKNVAPARLPKDCKLNVSVFEDEDIKNAIKEFVDNENI